MGTPVGEPPALIAEQIRRGGPIPFGAFVDAALYGPGGFFTRAAGAGRAGSDFVTSPEVGPLFGACVARALDAEWRRQDCPDPFVVVEAGAGNGRLAREVVRAEPECAPALHYILVERSAALRVEIATRLPLEPLADALGPSRTTASGELPAPVAGLGPILSVLDEFPALTLDGVVLANELLDNLVFDVVERSRGGWSEVRVGLEGDRFVEVLVAASPDLAAWLEGVDAPEGTRLPVTSAAVEWIVESARSLRRGSMILIDYTAPWSALVERSGAWLRTYLGHGRGSDPLDAPGSQDITVDVPRELVHRAARRAGLATRSESTQAEWLEDLGIEQLVAEGRELWAAGAAAPDLAAIAGRSRVSEAAALTDASGLGGHTVFVFTKHAP